MKKIGLFLILMSIICISYWWLPTSKDESTSEAEYTFIRTDSCDQLNCRILSANDLEFISFKVEKRYKEIFTKFKIKKDKTCIKSITLEDGRRMHFNCLPYFVKNKN